MAVQPSYSGLNIVKIICHQTGSCLQNVQSSLLHIFCFIRMEFLAAFFTPFWVELI